MRPFNLIRMSGIIIFSVRCSTDLVNGVSGIVIKINYNPCNSVTSFYLKHIIPKVPAAGKKTLCF